MGSVLAVLSTLWKNKEIVVIGGLLIACSWQGWRIDRGKKKLAEQQELHQQQRSALLESTQVWMNSHAVCEDNMHNLREAVKSLHSAVSEIENDKARVEARVSDASAEIARRRAENDTLRNELALMEKPEECEELWAWHTEAVSSLLRW